MKFSKAFPKTIQQNMPPVWQEITLSSEEERQAEELCRTENFRRLDQCLEDAKVLAIKHSVNTDENRAHLAIALFEKMASHVIFWKENKAKEKFSLENSK